jgi:hypothetical protein
MTRVAPMAAIFAVLTAGGADAGPIDQRALADTARMALAHWRVREQAVGWVGLHDEISSCFQRLEVKPSQSRAAYCIALDHYTLLDTLSFPEKLRPPYFGTNAVFARLDRAVAVSTPAPERAAFARAVLVTLDETLHADHEKTHR